MEIQPKNQINVSQVQHETLQLHSTTVKGHAGLAHTQMTSATCTNKTNAYITSASLGSRKRRGDEWLHKMFSKGRNMQHDI